MDDKNIVWKIQTYSTIDVLRFLLYRENNIVRNGFYMMTGGYFAGILLLMFYSEDIVMLKIVFYLLLLISCLACAFFFLSEMQHVNLVKKRWKQYGFDTKEYWMLLKKENAVFIQDGSRLINLSNCIADGMVCFVDRKKVFVFYLKKTGVFFIIQKTDPYYEEIRYHLEHAIRNTEIISPQKCLYQEKISCLYFARPFSNKTGAVFGLKSFFYSCLLVILFFAELFFLEGIFTFIMENRKYTGSGRNAIVFLHVLGCLLVILSAIWRFCYAFKESGKPLYFLNAYHDLYIFINQNKIGMRNANYDIEIPLDKRFIYRVTDKFRGHFLFYTKYGNFYINIPEDDKEKIHETGDLFRQYMIYS